MCGIAGILNSDHHQAADLRDLENMLSPIRHRGPDDFGLQIQQNVGFGFRRLSIIDVQNGHQPMSNEDGSVWIVFNGEIYNYRELRKDLISRGHIFRTNSDTETIVHLYEDFGTQCVSKLRGMFAFAIWDSKTRTLFCARDRFGIKPFFYYQGNEQFLFGSEIKSILQIVPTPPVDLGVLDYYMTYGYTNPDKTIYQKIQKLPPAHTLTLQAGGELKIERYWDIRFSPDFSVSEAEWEERILDKLRESVKLRLISDVPLGAFLSGGIDSGSVVALMAGLMDQPVKTFSIGFADKDFNELPQAREIAKRYETDHHELIVEPQSLDMLPLLVTSYDEPFADTSAIPSYIVSKFARQYVTVALSGDGGDELFAGYEHYQKLKAIENFHTWTGGRMVGVNRFLHRHIPRKIKGNGLTYYLSRPRDSFGAYYGKWQETERLQAYLPEVWRELSGIHAETVKKILHKKSLTKDFLSKMQEIDLRTWLTDDILTKVDRASMSNSLEVRVPILDHEFAELTFAIPSSFKIKGATKKHIFKQAARRLLPDSIINQPKRGFGVPLKSWFKQDLKDYFHDSLCSRDSELDQFFQSKFIEKLIADNSTGMRDLNHKLWPLVFLNEWLKSQKKKELEDVLQR